VAALAIGFLDLTYIGWTRPWVRFVLESAGWGYWRRIV